MPTKRRTSSRGSQEAADETDERGFTTSIGTTDEKEFTVRNSEVNAFQSSGSIRVMMMKILDFDHIEYQANNTDEIGIGEYLLRN
jgi:hypothetical protein